MPVIRMVYKTKKLRDAAIRKCLTMHLDKLRMIHDVAPCGVLYFDHKILWKLFASAKKIGLPRVHHTGLITKNGSGVDGLGNR
jgi:hypothetical protein